MLDSSRQREFGELWERVQEAALFYLFREGEYSGNARFGGHPEETPAELYASAYNLVHNQPEEFHAHLIYISSTHLPLLQQIVNFVSQ